MPTQPKLWSDTDTANLTRAVQANRRIAHLIGRIANEKPSTSTLYALLLNATHELVEQHHSLSEMARLRATPENRDRAALDMAELRVACEANVEMSRLIRMVCTERPSAARLYALLLSATQALHWQSRSLSVLRAVRDRNNPRRKGARNRSDGVTTKQEGAP